MNAIVEWLNQRRQTPDLGRVRYGRRVGHAVLCALAINIAHASIVAADDAPADATVRALAEVIKQVKAKYVGAVDDQKLVADAVRGMMQGLDPFSDYLEPEAYRELRQENRGKFAGLGMEVGMDAGAVRVISTFDDSPAFLAGLRPGDRITRLNEVSVEGMTLDQAIQRVRGEPDTSIALTVLRKGESEPRVVNLMRAMVQSRTVKSALLGSGYGYIRIMRFDQRTADSMLTALADMGRQSGGRLKGVLLDLRDNPGGLLKSAVAVSSVFLPEGSLVVYTEAAAAESRMRLQTTADQYLHGAEYLKNLPDMTTLPLVVLVNSGSASAAEIVAGALQDHRRAIVAGTQTFGKGSVQVLVPLADGAALKLTTAHYFTPNGQRIQGKGLTPDQVIEQPVTEPVAGAQRALLETKSTTVGEATACPIPDALGARDAAQLLDIPGNGEDCQLGRAMELLRDIPVLAHS